MNTFKIVIPYADSLIKGLPKKNIRIRRDSQKILALIEIITLLHHKQRTIDKEKNQIISSLADYYIVKTIFEKIIDKTLNEMPSRTRDLIEGAIEMVKGHVERQAMNFPISSYASDNLVLAIDRIRKRLRKLDLDAFFILTIHDALLIDSADSCSKQVESIVKELMPVTKKSKPGTEIVFSADVSTENHWVQ